MANAPFAIAHALLSKKLDVRAILAEQFGGSETTTQSYEEIMTILEAMDMSVPVFMGEEGSLAMTAGKDASKAVGVVLEPNCGSSVWREAPIINEDTSYRFESGRPMIKVYTSINSRFILEDFMCKLELVYGDK